MSGAAIVVEPNYQTCKCNVSYLLKLGLGGGGNLRPTSRTYSSLFGDILVSYRPGTRPAFGTKSGTIILYFTHSFTASTGVRDGRSVTDTLAHRYFSWYIIYTDICNIFNTCSGGQKSQGHGLRQVSPSNSITLRYTHNVSIYDSMLHPFESGTIH